MKPLALLLAAVLLPACVNQETVDYAFCDEDEACFSIVEPEPVVCGTRTCPATKCNVGWTCDGNDCISKGDLPGYDDHDECTDDVCDDETGEITHRAYTAEELDDGDPCTTDACTTEFGITHAYNCSATCNKTGC